MKRRERERGEEEGGDDGFKGEREQSLGGSNSPSCNFVNLTNRVLLCLQY